jgi:uncharacterized protein
MHRAGLSLSRRRVLRAGQATMLLWALPPLLAPSSARSQADHARVAVPFYRPAEAMQGLYRTWLLPHASVFFEATKELAASAREGCGSLQTSRTREAWIRTLAAWDALAAVPLGPLIERRTVRTIDFQPTRPALIERAIARAPRGAEALRNIGTPAKGLPALEWLLWMLPPTQRGTDGALPAAACAYVAELANELLRESTAIAAAVRTAADAEWDEARGDAAFAELLNQWVGAVERLRWTQIDKPRREAATRGQRRVPYPRVASGQTAASWHRQWQAIESLATIAGDETPQPGRQAVPLETYLRGRGLNPLADRWRAQVGRTSGALQGLQPDGAAGLEHAVRELAALKALAEAELAPAVQVSIGFSDADGD